MLSCFNCVQLCNPMDCSPLGYMSMGVFRQEHWSGLPCLTLGDLHNPGFKPSSLMSPALAAVFFIISTTQEALLGWCHLLIWDNWYFSWKSWSIQVFCMMYSAYKLNKQGGNIQAWCIPFPVLNQSIVPYPVLSVAFWPAYRFLTRQVRWFSIPIDLRIFHCFWSTQSKALV